MLTWTLAACWPASRLTCGRRCCSGRCNSKLAAHRCAAAADTCIWAACTLSFWPSASLLQVAFVAPNCSTRPDASPPPGTRSADEALLATLPPALMAEAQALQVCTPGASWHALLGLCCLPNFHQPVPSRGACQCLMCLLPSLPPQARMQRQVARTQAMNEAMQAAAQQVLAGSACGRASRFLVAFPFIMPDANPDCMKLA